MKKTFNALWLILFSISVSACTTVHLTDGMYPPNEFVIENKDATAMLGMSVRSEEAHFGKSKPFSTQVVVGRGPRQQFATYNGVAKAEEYNPPKSIGYEYSWQNVRQAGLELLDLKLKSLDVSAKFASNLDQDVTVKIEGISGKIDIGRNPALQGNNICSSNGKIGRSDPNAYVSVVYKLTGKMTVEVRNFQNQFGFQAKILQDKEKSKLEANGISLGIDEEGKGKLVLTFDSLWGIVHATEVECDKLGPKML